MDLKLSLNLNLNFNPNLNPDLNPNLRVGIIVARLERQTSYLEDFLPDWLFQIGHLLACCSCLAWNCLAFNELSPPKFNCLFLVKRGREFTPYKSFL